MSKYLDLEGLAIVWARIKALISEKADAVDGKGLSTNDYDDVEKEKLTNSVSGLSVSGRIISVTHNDGSVDRLTTQDTTYQTATDSRGGLMSASDKAKLDGIEAGVRSYVHPTYTEHTSGLYKVAIDGTGHVNEATAVTKADLEALGVPTSASSEATASSSGLMSAADKAKLDSFLDSSFYALKSDIVTAYIYRGTVQTVEELPSNPAVGDVWDVGDGMNYAWNGRSWDALGMTFTIDSMTIEDIEGVISDE